jgi:hypothetical protein
MHAEKHIFGRNGRQSARPLRPEIYEWDEIDADILDWIATR